ncbi:transposase [Zoogloea sp.]|uniref:transposase n=1 Tax=Zoogloea sp. TaxID=49181 RepID=UPI0035B1D662
MFPFEETPTKRSRRTFYPSFKLEVFNTLKNQGLSVSQLAKDMNLTASTMRRWVKYGFRSYPSQIDGRQLLGSLR